MSDFWFTDSDFEKLAKAREEGNFKQFYEVARSIKGFGYIPKQKIFRRYIADKIEREKAGLKKMVLRFPGKTWEISMKGKEEANLFGRVLAGASYSGMWFPNKRRLNAMDVATTTYPNKAGIWWYLLWDASGKTFVVQKYRFGKDNTLEPTREAIAIDAVDYYSDAFSSKFDRRSLRLRRTRTVRDVNENPFALLSTIGRNIHLVGRTRTPNLDFERHVISWNERLDKFLQADGKEKQKLFAQAKKRGKKWVITLGG